MQQRVGKEEEKKDKHKRGKGEERGKVRKNKKHPMFMSVTICVKKRRKRWNRYPVKSQSSYTDKRRQQHFPHKRTVLQNLM